MLWFNLARVDELRRTRAPRRDVLPRWQLQSSLTTATRFDLVHESKRGSVSSQHVCEHEDFALYRFLIKENVFVHFNLNLEEH